MTKQLKGSLYYLVTSLRSELFIFWAILLALLLVTVVSAIMIPDSIVSFSISLPLYAYAAAVGFITIKRTFPYLIKMGSTRKNLFISFGIFAFGLSLINAIVANTINKLVTVMLGKELGGLMVIENGTSMSFNHIGDFLGETSWLTKVIIDTSTAFFLLAIMFILGLIFYHFGPIGGFSFLGVIALIIILGISNGWLIDFIMIITRNYSITFFIQLFITGVVVYLISFLFLRRITV